MSNWQPNGPKRYAGPEGVPPQSLGSRAAGLVADEGATARVGQRGTRFPEAELRWRRLDVEARFGLPAGKYTTPNAFVAALVGMALTIAFYLGLVITPAQSVRGMFFQRGIVPPAIVFFASWCLGLLLLKWHKLRAQRRTLLYRIVPDDPSFTVTPDTADVVLENIHLLADDPKRFLLYHRVLVALSNLRNIRRIADVGEILRSQAEQDEAVIDNSYSLIRGLIWAVPVLGFIGTVVGLSRAIGEFGAVVGTATEMAELTTALRGVTSGLSTAFDTTLQGLVAALVLQMLATLLRKKEDDFLDACNEYCTTYLVNRLKVQEGGPGQD